MTNTQVIPDFDRLVESWRKGRPVTALSEKTGISTRVLSARLRREMDAISERKILLFLSQVHDECTWEEIRDSVGEKRLDELQTLNRLRMRGEVAERWEDDPPGQKVYGVHLYRLTAAGWAAVKNAEGNSASKG